MARYEDIARRLYQAAADMEEAAHELRRHDPDWAGEIQKLQRQVVNIAQTTGKRRIRRNPSQRAMA